MDSRFIAFDAETCDARIREILDEVGDYEESDNSIPSSNRLTFSNGFYVDCTAVFIDIRGSSSLPSTGHNRPVLAKLYRAFISECAAVLNGDPHCKQVFINGDCVSGIFETPTLPTVNTTLETAARLNSVINLLNWRLQKKNYTTIKCGIGVADGRALMLKAGHFGSNVNDIVWMGDVVNQASNLCHQGNKGNRLPVQISARVFDMLRDEYKSYFKPAKLNNFQVAEYEGDIVNIGLRDYLQKLQVVAPPLTGLFGLRQPPVNPVFTLVASPSPETQRNSLAEIMNSVAPRDNFLALFGADVPSNSLFGLSPPPASPPNGLRSPNALLDSADLLRALGARRRN